MQLFQIMHCRYTGLLATIDGYIRTGIPLVSYFNDNCQGPVNTLGPSGLGDNLGSYFFIPKFVELTGINVNIAIQLFYTGFTFFAFVIGTIGCWRYCKTSIGKWISIFGLAVVSCIIAGIGDYYVYAGAIPIALIPLWLELDNNGTKKNVFIFCIISGLVAAFGHLMRSHSGTSVLMIIIGCLLFTKRYSKIFRFSCIMAIGLVLFSAFFTFNKIVEKRNKFLTNIGCTQDLSGQRIMWHNAYYSLGYLVNDYGFNGWCGQQSNHLCVHEPTDIYSETKARSINPNVKLFSYEYENILKNEYFKFIKSHPYFFIKTVFAKLGVMFMYLILFGNIGLVLSFFYPNKVKFTLMFMIGIGFNILFELIASPEYQYLCGLFAFATMFGIFNIDNAINLKFLGSSNKYRGK